MRYDAREAGARCGECPLLGRTVVPPEGSPDARMVIIGEAPGFQEEKKGAPFVGPSGQMLNEMLRAAGLKRADVFLTNSILCRPLTPDVSGPKRFDMKTFLAFVRKMNSHRKKEATAAGRTFEPIPSPIDCCRPRLLHELQYLESRASGPNGLVVVPVGNFAAHSVLDTAPGITKIRGHVFDIDTKKLFQEISQ